MCTSTVQTRGSSLSFFNDSWCHDEAVSGCSKTKPRSNAIWSLHISTEWSSFRHASFHSNAVTPTGFMCWRFEKTVHGGLTVSTSVPSSSNNRFVSTRSAFFKKSYLLPVRGSSC